jgi:hypothetical protein
MKGKHEFSSRANLVENESRNEDRETEEEDKQEKKTTNMDVAFSPAGGGTIGR